MRVWALTLGFCLAFTSGTSLAQEQDLAERIRGVAEVERLASEVAAMAKLARFVSMHRFEDQDRAAWFARTRPEARRRALLAVDLADKLHVRAGFRAAADACRAYLEGLEGPEPDRAVREALADALYNQRSYLEAARLYEDLAGGGPVHRSDRDLLYSALQSLHHAFGSLDLGRAGQAEARARFERASLLFLRDHPEDPATAIVRFNRGRLAYDRYDLSWACEEFWLFIDRHPTHPEVPTAGHLILDAHLQQDDFGGLLQAAWRLLGDDRIEDVAFKDELRGIVGAGRDRAVD